MRALRVLRRNEARRNMTENKFTFTLFDSTASASGQKHRTHGNLIREAQCIRRMGASGKDVRVVFAGESSVKCGGIRLQDTQQRVRFRQMIKSASRPPKLPGFAIAGEGLVHCGTGAEVEEVRRRPDTALRLRPDAVEDSGINTVGVFVHIFVRNLHCFSDKINVKANLFPRHGEAR